MAKRKANMKNIIYELDDIEISSDEEVNVPKVNRPNSSKPQNTDKQDEIVTQVKENGSEVYSVDSTDDSICIIDSPRPKPNGGKNCPNDIVNIDSPKLMKASEDNSQDEVESDSVTKSNPDCEKTTIFNDDMDIDSPSSNAFCRAGCENRLPLVSVRFKNSKLSSNCRDKIKEFMIKLIKEHKEDSLVDSDNETDYELDIWPDDLDDEKNEVDDSLFFVDTAPCDNTVIDIPKYSQVSSIISNETKQASPPEKIRRGPVCFNCDGAHPLRDCKMRRNNARIAQNRQTYGTRVGRYHIEDDQKYGHLIPGRISGQLRHALGLKRNELPLHIYRMRMLGYPPGWLEEARISHSGMRMFDSTGNDILDPEDEDGEIFEAGSKDKFDIKKIMDFPGFNVPASSRYIEEGYKYGLPPLSEQDSKIMMLQMLAPNAMKAYKRKKLTFFPSSINNFSQEGHAEMELDSGDEETAFPSVPPLPDEAPPPMPPPPEQPPPPSPPLPPTDPESKSKVQGEPKKTVSDASTDKPEAETSGNTEIVEDRLEVTDDTIITIDEDSGNDNPRDGSISPTLVDLEKKKQILLEALQGEKSIIEDVDTPKANDVEDNLTDNTHISITEDADISKSNNVDQIVDEELDRKEETTAELQENAKTDDNSGIKPLESNNKAEISTTVSVNDDKNIASSNDLIDRESTSTPESKTGHVRNTSYGTPVLNIASSFVKLPSDDKFSKDICDVINFENLPNSIGKYKKISSLLRKVKNEVDRIQES